MYLGSDDNLTRAERDRMNAIANRLHWLGLAIQQATVSGDWVAVQGYEAEKRALQAEQVSLRQKATASGAERTERAEAGPLGPLVDALKSIPVFAGLGIAAYLIWKLR